MGKKGGKGKRKKSICQSMQQPRSSFGVGEDGRCLQNRLEHGIKGFFYAVDEDCNGFLEKHEFVVAQTVIAELAGDLFDDDTAARHFEEYEAFDKNRDNHVDVDEFTSRMLDLCEVLPQCREEILEELRKRTATVVAHVRRRVGNELRSIFSAVDVDHSGSLNREELANVSALWKDLALEGLGSAKAADDFLKFESFDLVQDGKVSVDEFIEHFLDMLKFFKVPKRDVLEKLQNVREAAESANKALECKTCAGAGWCRDKEGSRCSCEACDGTGNVVFDE